MHVAICLIINGHVVDDQVMDCSKCRCFEQHENRLKNPSFDFWNNCKFIENSIASICGQYSQPYWKVAAEFANGVFIYSPGSDKLIFTVTITATCDEDQDYNAPGNNLSDVMRGLKIH